MSESGMDPNNGTALDPRIKEELELLNTASAEINRLEKQLDESRQAFRQTLTESTQSLNEKIKKCRKSAAKAQGYYFAKEEARKAQEMAQEAALRYQRASGMYTAAKETIAIAEETALTSKRKPQHDTRRRFDSALQEMLNLSTEKLNSAEQEKRESQKEHETRSKHYITSQQLVDQLAKKFKRSISKSAEYYELKKSFFYELNDLKTRTEALQSALTESKAKYRGALKHLEQISEDIHQSRQVEAILAESRQSGVGADSNTDSETEHEKLDITFHIEDSTDGESIITDSSSAASCTSPSPAFHHRSVPRSISGSSLPSPAEWDNDKANNKFDFEVTAKPGSHSNSSALSKRDSMPKIHMDTLDDCDEDDEDINDDTLFADVDVDSDSDDDNDTKGKLNVTRKLRTISIGDLKSFSVYDNGDDIDIETSANSEESRADSMSHQATADQIRHITNNEFDQTPSLDVKDIVKDVVEDTVKDTAIGKDNETVDETVTDTVDEKVEETFKNIVNGHVEETFKNTVNGTVEETGKDMVNETARETVKDIVNETVAETVQADVQSRLENKNGSCDVVDGVVDEKDDDGAVWI